MPDDTLTTAEPVPADPWAEGSTTTAEGWTGGDPL